MERAVNKLQETRKESTERQSREKINPNEKVTIWGVKMGFLPHYWGLQDAGTSREYSISHTCLQRGYKLEVLQIHKQLRKLHSQEFRKVQKSCRVSTSFYALY